MAELTDFISSSQAPPEPSGSTPFGLYDDNDDFSTDAKSTALWVAGKLGSSTVQVEMTWEDVYSCFEEAISEYSTMVNNSNMKDWMLTYYGTPTGSDRNYTQKFPQNRFNFMKSHGESVASEVGAGGNVEWKTGSIELQEGQQDYDLQELYGNVSESGKRLDIKEIWHYQESSAVGRGYNRFGQEFINNEFGGMGGVPAANRSMYYLFPVYQDISRAQSIELSDKVRRSAYSYEVIDNKLKIYPVPQEDKNLWFRYVVDDDPIDEDNNETNGVSDVSNVPYEFMDYDTINSSGKQWIRKYTLALSKELLGNIRRKYDTVPIPNNEVNLDGSDLISDARDEKQSLKEELQTLLDETSNEKLIERQANIEEKNKDRMSQFPILPKVK